MERKPAIPFWRECIEPLRSAPLPHANSLRAWGGRRTLSSSRRFRIDVAQGPGSSAGVRVFDHSVGKVLFHWTGATARHLLERGFLINKRWVDKQYVQHLALAAASVDASRFPDEATRGHAMSHETRRGDSLPTSHHPSSTSLQRHVATLLRRYRQHHFSRIEVAMLLAIENRAVTQDAADRCLDELVAAGELQRIDVPGKNVFFDIDTTPHVHLYDAEQDAVRDAHDTKLLIARTGRPVVVVPAN